MLAALAQQESTEFTGDKVQRAGLSWVDCWRTRQKGIRGYIGIVEKKMETIGIIWGFIGIIGYILGLHWDNGKENGSYCSILGLHWDNG